MFGASAMAHRGKVHSVVRTAQGPVTLIMEPAIARTWSEEMSRAANEAGPFDKLRAGGPETPHRNLTEAAAAGAPLHRPNGR